jgi:hypothetical protein
MMRVAAFLLLLAACSKQTPRRPYRQRRFLPKLRPPRAQARAQTRETVAAVSRVGTASQYALHKRCAHVVESIDQGCIDTTLYGRVDRGGWSVTSTNSTSLSVGYQIHRLRFATRLT